MALATALHWDRFNAGHPTFWAWVLLYVVSPPLVLAFWLRNRRTDPGTLEADDLALPPGVRVAFATVGVVLLALAVLLVAFPTQLVGIWPWMLTPLTARVMGGWLALSGVTFVMVASDRRWSAARIVLQCLVFAYVLSLIAAARAWNEFSPDNPLRWVFVGGVAGLIVLVAIVAVVMERRRAGLPATDKEAIGRA
jgi:hypothetical protein